MAVQLEEAAFGATPDESGMRDQDNEVQCEPGRRVLPIVAGEDNGKSA